MAYSVTGRRENLTYTPKAISATSCTAGNVAGLSHDPKAVSSSSRTASTADVGGLSHNPKAVSASSCTASTSVGGLEGEQGEVKSRDEVKDCCPTRQIPAPNGRRDRANDIVQRLLEFKQHSNTFRSLH